MVGECFSDVVVEVFFVVDEDICWVYCVCGLVLIIFEDKFDCLVLIFYDVIEWVSVE